jgi:membrane-associated protein
MLPLRMLADLSFLTGLHGSIATVLICALLIADEAGVPLPFAPNEVLLVVAGLLIASGGENVFIFYPLALAALIAGSWTGYSWARKAGSTQLAAIADRLKARRHYDRAVRRISGASSRQIFVTRLIPGIRVYATLAAGAAQVPMRTFMRGSIPALVVWSAVMTTLGFLVGIPAVYLLGKVEDMALSGGLFVLLGFVAYRAVRRAPSSRDEPQSGPFYGIARRDRYILAVAVDAGVVATVTVGFDRLIRAALNFKLPLIPEKSIFEPLTIIAVIALTYVVVSRRSSTGETAGERLFDVSYVHPRLAPAHPGDPHPEPERTELEEAAMPPPRDPAPTTTAGT